MSQIFLGVDVGATKTHALIADETGLALGFGEAGPGNHEVVGYDGLAQAIHDSVHQALQRAGRTIGEIQGAGFGVAGYDWPGELEPTLEAISKLGLSAPIEAVNDTIIGLVAGAEQGWGVGLVSGTGCNCWGWDEKHNIGRVTGMGDWFGEYAGGGDIVHRAIIAVAYQAFRRGPATQLTPALLEFTKAKDAMDLMEGLTLGRYQVDASAAPLVIQIAQQGDPVAVGILQWAGSELGELASCVIRQINLEDREFDVVLIGSIYQCGELLMSALRKTVHQTAPKARFVQLKAPPVVGGVLLGMQWVRQPSPEIRSRLISSAGELFSRLRNTSPER